MFPTDDPRPGPPQAPEAAGPASASGNAATASVSQRRDAAIAEAILGLTAARGPDRSICPSEAARMVAVSQGLAEWSPLMGNVRRIALCLQATGQVQILRKGCAVPASQVRGVIRLRQAATAGEPAAPACDLPNEDGAA